MKAALLLVIPALAIAGCMAMVKSPQGTTATTVGTVNADGKPQAPKLHKSNAEWKKSLTADQFEVLRNAGTEPAFHNQYFDNHVAGTYSCAACGQKLFSSKTKFESGTGWPSFWAPIEKGAVIYKVDKSDGMVREEVECSNCGSHLGHLFDDGPKPTGQRYCMNSISMKFEPAGK